MEKKQDIKNLMEVNQTVKELKQIAREQGIKGWYRMRKAELIDVLFDMDIETPKLLPENNKTNKYNCIHGNRINIFVKNCGGIADM